MRRAAQRWGNTDIDELVQAQRFQFDRAFQLILERTIEHAGDPRSADNVACQRTSFGEDAALREPMRRTFTHIHNRRHHLAPRYSLRYAFEIYSARRFEQIGFRNALSVSFKRSLGVDTLTR